MVLIATEETYVFPSLYPHLHSLCHLGGSRAGEIPAIVHKIPPSKWGRKLFAYQTFIYSCIIIYTNFYLMLVPTMFLEIANASLPD